jgi:hypothetical protein
LLWDLVFFFIFFFFFLFNTGKEKGEDYNNEEKNKGYGNPITTKSTHGSKKEKEKKGPNEWTNRPKLAV